MFLKGINYDVGTYYSPDACSRPVFDEDIIRNEVKIIKDELH